MHRATTIAAAALAAAAIGTAATPELGSAHALRAAPVCEAYGLTLTGFPDGVTGTVRIHVTTATRDYTETLPTLEPRAWLLRYVDWLPAGVSNVRIAGSVSTSDGFTSPETELFDGPVGPCPGPPASTPESSSSSGTPASSGTPRQAPTPAVAEARVTCAWIPAGAGRRWYQGPKGTPGLLGIACPLPRRYAPRYHRPPAVLGELAPRAAGDAFLNRAANLSSATIAAAQDRATLSGARIDPRAGVAIVDARTSDGGRLRPARLAGMGPWVCTPARPHRTIGCTASTSGPVYSAAVSYLTRAGEGQVHVAVVKRAR